MQQKTPQHPFLYQALSEPQNAKSDSTSINTIRALEHPINELNFQILKTYINDWPTLPIEIQKAIIQLLIKYIVFDKTSNEATSTLRKLSKTKTIPTPLQIMIIESSKIFGFKI